MAALSILGKVSDAESKLNIKIRIYYEKIATRQREMDNLIIEKSDNSKIIWDKIQKIKSVNKL